MKKNIWFFIECLFLLFPAVSNAANPSHWICDDRAYEYDMSMYINLYQRGILLEKWDKLEIAAFCGEECRGVAVVEEINGRQGSYYYMRVRSNVTLGETITFKSYNHEKAEEAIIPESIEFTASGISGYPSSPFKLTVPFVEVTGVSLNKTSVTLYTGTAETLSASLAPLNATDKSVSWSSDNTSVTTVENGVIRAVKAGQATITVTTADGNHTATCSITVLQHVTGVSLNKSTTTLYTGSTEILLATIAPLDATDKTISWSSDNPSIATVENGVIKGVKSGQATITVTTADGNHTAICLVTILQHVTGVSLNKTTTTLYTGSTETLLATITPLDATDKTISWSSDNPSVATVENGIIKGVKSGQANIVVTTVDGNHTATCSVTVLQHVTGVGLNKSTLSLSIGDVETLIATVSPSDATDKAAHWESDNPSIATVDQNGLVTGIQAGIASITVSTVDGNYTATCSVVVIKHVTDVSLDKTSVTLYTGTTEALSATVSPSDASDKSVSWISNNPSVATVENGTVRAIKAGQAKVIVTTSDGNYSDTCSVTVLQHATGISLNKNELSFYIGDTETLLATVSPLDATNKTFVWSSDAPSIVTVDADGLVTGVQSGQANITATTEDGNFQASCLVTVSRAVTGVRLNKDSLDLKVDETATLIATVVPEDATNKSIIWSSEDEAIAFIDQNGLVHALKVGKTSITATTEEGQFTVLCQIFIAPGVGIGTSEWNAIKVYPTVTDSYIYIYGLSGYEKIILVDSRGCLVQYYDVENEKYKIDLSGLSKGLYLLMIDGNTHLSEWKIIKQ